MERYVDEVSFGEWLKHRRKAAGLTQEQLAQQISCSTSALRKIEAEERRPSEPIIKQLADVFNIPSAERASFLKFARGNLDAAPMGIIENSPWRVAPPAKNEREDPSKPRIHLATFLFTDIEDSTKLWESAPEKMKVALQRHHAILQEAITSNGGEVFQIIGDAFCAVFTTAPSALSAAVTAQRGLHQEPWDLLFPIRVRMGIHAGEAERNSNNSPAGGYTSNQTMNRVARILKAGHGGQVLLSLVTKELVKDSLPANTELGDMGEHYLKNLVHPEHLFQLNIAGLPSDFPPLNTLNIPRHNLPLQLTNFIGREKEIADVIRLHEEARLVTLIGPGGTGKTRLSIEVANELLAQYADGVWMVELAPILDPLLISRTIAIAIGLRDEPHRPVIDVLCDYLREKRLLLILDNCEHLVDACAQLADTLLHACPYIRILASSREALSIAGETSYLVPSLQLPNMQSLPTMESLNQCEASQLFIERALATTQHFMVTDENAFSIAQICHRLDGIPLAIELAAAKVRALSAGQIAQRLDDRFRLLTSGNRTALPRHQTLHAAIDWSYNLLSPGEQILFRRLSMFVNGWTLEAAEEVCAGDGIKSDEILDLLTQLVNKSLVIVIEHSQGGETRYRMLETIRQYAREKLLEAGGGEIVRDQHLAYFVKLAERAEPELYRSNQVYWLNKLDDELDNIRTAMESALATDFRSGLQLIVNLATFWEVRGDIREEESWLKQLLEHYAEADSLRARALVNYANLEGLEALGNLSQAQFIINQGLELSRAISDKHVEAYSLLSLGTAIALQGDLRRGIPIVEQSLALYKLLGDKFGEANATFWLSLNHNDLELSKAFLRESLRLNRELGNLSGIAYSLNTLAQRTIWGGDFSSPVQWLEEAREISRQLGRKSGEASVFEMFGTLSYWQGDYQQACAYYEESIALDEKVGISWLPWTRVNMAYAFLRQGDIVQAIGMFRHGIQQFQKAKNVIGLVYTLEGFASLHVNQRQPERAARLFAWADATREQIGDFRPPVEQASVEKDLAAIHSKLNDTEYSKLSAEGRAMSTEQAIAYALEELQ